MINKINLLIKDPMEERHLSWLMYFTVLKIFYLYQQIEDEHTMFDKDQDNEIYLAGIGIHKHTKFTDRIDVPPIYPFSYIFNELQIFLNSKCTNKSVTEIVEFLFKNGVPSRMYVSDKINLASFEKLQALENETLQHLHSVTSKFKNFKDVKSSCYVLKDLKKDDALILPARFTGMRSHFGLITTTKDLNKFGLLIRRPDLIFKVKI